MVETSSKDELYDISDSTDWLDTPLASLAPVDAGLRCQVCKDFYKTPMVTSCSHTFCSLCIRRCLANDGKCPTCRATEQENKLRRNGLVESLVEDFLTARPALLEHARKKSSEVQSLKRNLDDADLAEIDSGPRKKTRSSSRLATRVRVENRFIMPDGEGDDHDYQPEDDDRLECPICGKQMEIQALNKHVNKCLDEGSGKKLVAPIHTQNPSLKSGLYSFQKPPNKLERLPHLNYSIYKETALRKKLQELGISTQGSRQVLEKRHAEWVTLWNANCDATKPRRKAELLHDLDVWERTRATSNSNLSPANQVMHKDFDGAGWAAKHDQSFQDLIASARKKLGKRGDRQMSTAPVESGEQSIGGTKLADSAAQTTDLADNHSLTNIHDSLVIAMKEPPDTITSVPSDHEQNMGIDQSNLAH